MGINYQSLGSTSQIVRLPAAVAIAAGDLVVNLEGKVSKPDLALPLAHWNRTAAGATAVYPVTIAGTNYGRNDDDADTSLVEMPNGDVWHASTGDGTTPTTGVRIARKNRFGATVANEITVSTTAGSANVWIVKTTGDKVVVAWTETGNIRFAIYNADGTVATATATVSAVASANRPAWQVAVLSSGDIVFAYCKTSIQPNFTRYNSSGVLQGAETLIVAENASDIAVKAQTAGGFVVLHRRSDATATWKFARYSATGVLQGSLTDIIAGVSIRGGNAQHLITELSSGNIVFQVANASGQPVLAVYTSAGVVVNTTTFTNTEQVTNSLHCVVPTPSGFTYITAGHAVNTGYFHTFDFSGVAVQAATGFAHSGSSDSESWATAKLLPDGNYAVVFYGYRSGGSYSLTLMVLSPVGAVIGTNIVLQASDGSPRYLINLMRHSSGYLITSFRFISSLRLAVYDLYRSSVLGVALDTVAAAESCRVATAGTWQVNQTVSAGVFDQRSATVQGTKGILLGSSAVLLGLN